MTKDERIKELEARVEGLEARNKELEGKYEMSRENEANAIRSLAQSQQMVIAYQQAALSQAQGSLG